MKPAYQTFTKNLGKRTRSKNVSHKLSTPRQSENARWRSLYGKNNDRNSKENAVMYTDEGQGMKGKAKKSLESVGNHTKKSDQDQEIE